MSISTVTNLELPLAMTILHAYIVWQTRWYSKEVKNITITKRKCINKRKLFNMRQFILWRKLQTNQLTKRKRRIWRPCWTHNTCLTKNTNNNDGSIFLLANNISTTPYGYIRHACPPSKYNNGSFLVMQNHFTLSSNRVQPPLMVWHLLELCWSRIHM